jgi:hypothetical protein
MGGGGGGGSDDLLAAGVRHGHARGVVAADPLLDGDVGPDDFLPVDLHQPPPLNFQPPYAFM